VPLGFFLSLLLPIYIGFLWPYRPRTVLVDSYLRGRSLRVRVEHVKSGYHATEAGVPQGSVLGPHLFAVYTANFPRKEGTILAQYADDTAIGSRCKSVATATRRTQEALDEISDWCLKWKMTISAEKSKVFLIRGRKIKVAPERDLTINEDNIPWDTEVKYLGVTIDHRLTQQKAKAARAKLTPLIGGYSRLRIRQKLTLIKTIVVPILTYAWIIWGYTCKTNRKKIQSQENICLRRAVNAPWFVSNKVIFTDEGKSQEDVRKTSNPLMLTSKGVARLRSEVYRSLSTA